MAYMIDARAALLFSMEHMKEGSAESSNGLRFNPKKSLYMICSIWASLPIECCFQRAAPGSVRAISKEIAGQEQAAQASPSLRLEALNLRKSGDSRPHICGRHTRGHGRHSKTALRSAAPQEARQLLLRPPSPGSQQKEPIDKNSFSLSGSLGFPSRGHT